MNNLKALRAAMTLRPFLSARFHLQFRRSLAQKISTPKIPNSASSTNRIASEPEEINEPMKYFGSKAATWRAKDTRSGGAENQLWYQPLVISGSLAVFLLYFCIFREESDIDQKLERNLYDHVPALEEVQLSLMYQNNKESGRDNREVIRRLVEMGVDIKALDKRFEFEHKVN